MVMTPAQGRKQRRELMRDIARHHRREAREKLVSLRAQIRDARALRRIAIAQAKERCRAERVAVNARARAMKQRALEELREGLRRQRQVARDTCAAGLTDARGIVDKVQRARAELQAERAYRRDLRRIERANRAGRLQIRRPSRSERRGESDDEVRGNIPPEFVGLWERVQGRIRGSDRMTRTEAFLQYAHDHPNEVLEVLEDRTEALIHELEARERKAARELKRPKPRRAAAALEDAPF
jgi:hypothetical protein